MEQNVIHGFYSETQKKKLNEYYTCQNKLGDNIICTTFKSNNNIEESKPVSPCNHFRHVFVVVFFMFNH